MKTHRAVTSAHNASTKTKHSFASLAFTLFLIRNHDGASNALYCQGNSYLSFFLGIVFLLSLLLNACIYCHSELNFVPIRFKCHVAHAYHRFVVLALHCSNSCSGLKETPWMDVQYRNHRTAYLHHANRPIPETKSRSATQGFPASDANRMITPSAQGLATWLYVA